MFCVIRDSFLVMVHDQIKIQHKSNIYACHLMSVCDLNSEARSFVKTYSNVAIQIGVSSALGQI